MIKRNRKRKYPKNLFILCFAIFLFIGVGYSIINSTLGINGTVINSKNSWDIKLANITYDEDSVIQKGATISNDTELSVNATLNKPTDIYSFTVDLVNNGSLSAIIETIEMTALSEEEEKIIRYSVTYDDGTELERLDAIKGKETKKIRVRLEYKKLRDESIYGDSDLTLSLKINLRFKYPDEEMYKVTVARTGESKSYDVSNQLQELTLSDITVQSSEIAIACNNGVVPTTNSTNQIVLKKVKQDATCRIVNSLKEGIENGSNNESVTLLNNDNLSTITKITIPVENTIKLDLNGKTNIAKSGTDFADGYIINKGNLSIVDSKGNGTLQADKALLENETTGTLTINGGKYIRKNPSANASEPGGVIGRAGNITIKNAYVDADATYSIFLNKKTLLNIYNSTIKNGPYQYHSLVSHANEATVNVYSSNIESGKSPIHVVGNFYLCKTTITSADKNDIQGNNGTVYYSSDSTFSSNTNVPSFKSYTGRMIDTDLACGE